MRLGDQAAQVKAQADTATAAGACRVGTVKRSVQLLQVRVGHTRAVVSHCQQHTCALQ